MNSASSELWLDRAGGWLTRTLLCSAVFGVLAMPASVSNGASPAGEPELEASLARGTPASLARMTLAENARIIERGSSAAARNAEIPLSSAPLETMASFHLGGGTAARDVAQSCLAQAVYYEAANEPLAGKRAVAQVVLNRLRHPAYPSSVCGVVYEGWNQPVCQFSFVCDGSLQRAPVAAQWSQARAVAREALAGHVERAVGSATHYHADYVLPRWGYTLAKVRQVGRHLFYRFPGQGGRANSFTGRWNGHETIPVIDFSRFAYDASQLAGNVDGVALSAGSQFRRDPTERRADNDIGGRMDPSKGWRLSIPDPVTASAGYDASRRAQNGQGPDADAGDLAPTGAANP